MRGLRSVPFRQILRHEPCNEKDRHRFTPFSMTQVHLENAAGPQDVSKSYGRLLHGPCTSCSGALFVPPPHLCSWCCVVIVLSSFGDFGIFWFLSLSPGPPKSDALKHPPRHQY